MSKALMIGPISIVPDSYLKHLTGGTFDIHHCDDDWNALRNVTASIDLIVLVWSAEADGDSNLWLESLSHAVKRSGRRIPLLILGEREDKPVPPNAHVFGKVSWFGLNLESEVFAHRLIDYARLSTSSEVG